MSFIINDSIIETQKNQVTMKSHKEEVEVSLLSTKVEKSKIVVT
jgi:hypothetical protein